MRLRNLALSAAAGALLLGSLTPMAANAADRPTGIDVSYPNCGSTLPATDFMVVGVNNGRGRTDNPCLAAQLSFAQFLPGTAHPRLDVYVNTQNPTPTAASWWPTSDRTLDGARTVSPYGHCSGGKSAACSWVYGASIARDDLTRLAATGFTGRPGRWWLDVETANSWSASTSRNRAALEGMTAALVAAKQAVGLYALRGEFADILGTVPASSPLTKLPSWIAGTADQGHAQQVCSSAPLTAGRVTLVQWRDVAAGLDRDVACQTLSSTPKPKVTGTFRTGHRLTARAGSWRPGAVHLAYRWTRDGKPIANAVGSTYTLKKADRKHRVAVTVTGTESGFSRSVQTSAAHRIRP